MSELPPPDQFPTRRGVSIRTKIVLAFLVISFVSGLAAYYAVSETREAGRLVVEAYDKPLMSISFARAVHADFSAMESAFVRRLLAKPADRAALDRVVDERGSTLSDDLGVVRQRSTTLRARRSVGEVERAVAAWQEARKKIIAQGTSDAEWKKFDAISDIVREQIDLLVNYAAGDGFIRRQETIATIARNERVQIGAFLVALLASIVVTVALARRIMGPVAAASKAAERIAHGELDAQIPISGRDELASLLVSMSAMRDSIREMVERERMQRRSAQARLVDAIDSSLEGVLVVDRDGKIVIANAQAQQFFGAASEFVRRNGDLADVVTAAVERAAFAPESTAEAAAIAPANAQQLIDVELKLSDGRWLRVVRSPTSEGGCIVILSDISLLKEREFVLRMARDRAESANRAKTEFLTNMGHELRTPLNAVIGFSEMISREMFGPAGHPKYREFADDIVRSGRHLLAVINDILDLSKSEAGKIELDIKPVLVSALFEDMRRFVQEDFTRAKLSLDVVMPLPGMTVMADDVKLKQVLLNLLSNAAKFTPAGGFTRLQAADDERGRVRISVCDSGIGMRAEDIPLALSPFGQIDSRLARKYEGTGLGLALSKALVELHGGELVIESKVGVGTTVSLALSNALAGAQMARSA